MRYLLLLALFATGCAPDTAMDDEAAADSKSSAPNCAVVAASPSCDAPPVSFTGAARHRAEVLTSLFENRTIDLQYDYIEALGDGRGYTAGRAGFTTATGDLLMVAERYTELEPDNALVVLLPRLRQVAVAGSDSIEGLEDLPFIWQEIAADPLQRQVQDEIVNHLYFWPAMQVASCVGANLPLSLAFLYDTIIQHGDGDIPPDSLGALVERARLAAGGDPSTGIDERTWLHALMVERRKDLAHACTASTRAEWADSVDRVDVFLKLLSSGNLYLSQPFTVQLDGDTYGVP